LLTYILIYKFHIFLYFLLRKCETKNGEKNAIFFVFFVFFVKIYLNIPTKKKIKQKFKKELLYSFYSLEEIKLI